MKGLKDGGRGAKFKNVGKLSSLIGKIIDGGRDENCRLINDSFHNFMG
jgi:hypothetical protein